MCSALHFFFWKYNHRDSFSPFSSSENQLFLRVTIAISRPLIVFSEVVGWIYFAAWSVSFYPQIYINFKRRSVVGYSFDYVSLNIVGFIMYSVFNCGLFWIKYIQVTIRKQSVDQRFIMRREFMILGRIFSTIPARIKSSSDKWCSFRFTCRGSDHCHHNSMLFLWAWCTKGIDFG